MNVNPMGVATYLTRYVVGYRNEYERFTSPPPRGGGYPRLLVSPYLYSPKITCYLAEDGVAIADYSQEPEYRWDIAGGPTLLFDYPDTRTPPDIIELLKDQGLWGKPIGIYRIVSQTQLPDEVWTGRLDHPIETVKEIVDNTVILVHAYDLDWHSLIMRLTFGAFGAILDVKLRPKDSPFWIPHIVSNLGFATADRKYKRFFHYLELLPHVDLAAWDIRNIATRVRVDLRRDYARTVGSAAEGGTLSFGDAYAWVEHYFDRVSRLGTAIEKFENLLEQQASGDEAIFHSFLKEHPILLDVYGQAMSKPRFHYPEGESPIGKEYIEPDFILRFPGNSYRLVELEKPSKKIATKQGQPRSEITQSSFQIAEWKAYIKNHYDLLKDQFPGIAVNFGTMIVISRSSVESFGVARDVRRYRELIKEQFAVDEVLTYDDLLARAKQAYVALSSLTISSSNE